MISAVCIHMKPTNIIIKLKIKFSIGLVNASEKPSASISSWERIPTSSVELNNVFHPLLKHLLNMNSGLVWQKFRVWPKEHALYTQIAWMRLANVGLWLVSWLMVGVGFVTLGQRRGQRATLHWANADCQRWPNVATDAGPTLANVGPTHSSGTVAQRMADEQNYVGPTPFLWCWANMHVLPWANLGPT